MSIGEAAFYICDSLTSIEIPASVTSIVINAFRSCTKLTSVTFADPTGWRVSRSTASPGIDISSSSLANASTAATYLTATYDNYYWKKS